MASSKANAVTAVGALVLIAGLSACMPISNPHEKYLREDLSTVSYHNGIAITEAKIIADAYLYMHGSERGRVRHARIRDGGDRWYGDVIGGVGVSPLRTGLPPVEIDKNSGVVSWPQGPTLARVELPPPKS